MFETKLSIERRVQGDSHLAQNLKRRDAESQGTLRLRHGWDLADPSNACVVDHCFRIAAQKTGLTAHEH